MVNPNPTENSSLLDWINNFGLAFGAISATILVNLGIEKRQRKIAKEEASGLIARVKEKNTEEFAEIKKDIALIRQSITHLEEANKRSSSISEQILSHLTKMQTQ